MYEYIKGKIAELGLTSTVIEANSVGYHINISVNTYETIVGEKEVKLFLHQVVREDAHLLYGFANNDERALFRLLISVSGIGSNTAMVMLSSQTQAEIRAAILAEDVNFLKRIKGIGAKTAQRVIIDLKDKLDKIGLVTDTPLKLTANDIVREDALSALSALGLARKSAEKVIDSILKKEPSTSVESLIKQALKLL